MTKSKQRIAEFGEVFTPIREINAMLDLVAHETYRIDARFLEPACGNGNFLIEVLRRKVDEIQKKYIKNKLDFERYSFLAVASIYGIDILEDNIEECRARLSMFIEEIYRVNFKEQVNKEFINSINFILSKNIIFGDALTLQQGNSLEPITFSEWCFTRGSKIKRTEYTMGNILAYQPMEGDNLFSDLGDKAFIPKPSKVYPEINFLEISHAQ